MREILVGPSGTGYTAIIIEVRPTIPMELHTKKAEDWRLRWEYTAIDEEPIHPTFYKKDSETEDSEIPCKPSDENDDSALY